MSDRFTESALRLAGIAGAVLGWRAAEFWAATPAEMAVVVRALSGDEGARAGGDDLARLRGMFPDG